MATGIINKVKRGIRGSIKRKNKYRQQEDDYFSDEDVREEFNDRSSNQQSPTCVVQQEFNNGRDPSPLKVSLSIDDERNLATPTLSTSSTFVTSNLGIEDEHHVQPQENWVNFVAWGNENQTITSFPSSPPSTTIAIKEISLGPSLKNYISLVMPPSIQKKYEYIESSSKLRSSGESSALSDEEIFSDHAVRSSIERNEKPSLVTERMRQARFHVASPCLDENVRHFSHDCTISTVLGEEPSFDDSSGRDDEDERSRTEYDNSFNAEVRHVNLDYDLKKSYNTACAHLRKENYDDAIQDFLEFAKHQIEYSGKEHTVVGFALHNIGVVYFWKENYSLALQYANESLACRTKILTSLEVNDEKQYKHKDEIMDVATSLLEVGTAQYALSKFTDSLASLRESLQVGCKVHGYGHPRIARILNIIGCIHFEEGRFMEAQATFEECLDIQRERIGDNSTFKAVGKGLLNIAIVLGNVAMCFLKRKVWDDAYALLEEAIMVQASVLGESHSTVKVSASTLSIIETIKKSSAFDDVAEDPFLQKYRYPYRAEDRNDLPVGPLSPSHNADNIFGESDNLRLTTTIRSCNFERIDYIYLGSLQNEETPVQRVRTLILNEFYSSSITMFLTDTIQQSAGMGSINGNLVFDDDGRICKSFSRDEQYDKLADPELHLRDIYTRIIQYLQEGRIDKALNILERVLCSHKEKFGDVHHLVGTCLHNKGLIYMFAQQYSKALPTLKEAVKIRSKALGHDHPDVSVSLIKAGITQYALCEYDNALVTFCEVLRLRRKNLGYAHPLVTQVLNNIGALHYEYGGMLAALKAFEEALEIQRCQLENNPTDLCSILSVAGTLFNVGFVHVRRKEYGEAIVIFEEALKLYRQVLGEEDGKVKMTLDNLAFALAFANAVGDSKNAFKVMNIYKDMLRS